MTNRLRARRGSALILVLLMTLAVAALAIAAIFMSGSASLLSRFYDRERQFSYAAESALQRVISSLKADTAFVVSSLVPEAPVLDLVEVQDASGNTIPGARVRVWAARTFDTSPSGPVTISLLAQVVDASGTRFVRRTDLRQDAFSTYALATNSSTNIAVGPFNISTNVPYSSGAFISGKIHVNGSWGTVGGTPSYRDSVFATGTVLDPSNRFTTGKFEGVDRLAWPSSDSVRATDSVAALAGNHYIEVSSTRPTRLEFFVRDDDGDGHIGPDEGYLRAFELRNGDVASLRAARDEEQNDDADFYDWSSSLIQNQCGAFYFRNGAWRFFPVATHRAGWAWAIIDSAGAIPGPPSSNDWGAQGNRRRDATQAILTQPTARCFPAGSPFLIHTSSFTNGGGQLATNNNHGWPWGMRGDITSQTGGSDAVVHAVVRTCTFNMAVGASHECQGNTAILGEWRSLGPSLEMPLDRGGGAVVFADRSVFVHGTVAGRVTLFVRGDATIVDRIVHAGGPNDLESDCAHLFGLVAEHDIIIDDNSLVGRRRLTNANANWILPGAEDGFSLHGSYFALTGAFSAVGAGRRTGNSASQLECAGVRHAGGCLNLSGSIAAHETRSLSSATSRGFRLNRSADACLERGYRPPNYPLANRYRVLRSVNVRPAAILGENGIADYFASLQGSSDIP